MLKCTRINQEKSEHIHILYQHKFEYILTLRENFLFYESIERDIDKEREETKREREREREREKEREKERKKERKKEKERK